jgi:7-keto-8-aminopelargonate synthetase-like enzyme
VERPIAETVSHPGLADPEAFAGNVAQFARPRGPDLLARNEPLRQWVERRQSVGVFPYARALMTAPASHTTLRDGAGREATGINFASQDYLSLARHPAVVEAATRAIRDFGVHSAGSGMLSGNTRMSLQLEEELGALLRAPQVMLFPTGWAAAFGTIVGLVRPYDHVVLDNLAHASLQQGAAAATPQVHRHPHLDVEAARNRLSAIRADDARCAILVVTEGLFSMDSDVGRLRELQETCRDYGAVLLVDVAHDLGASGPGGSGEVGIQGVLGEVDLVMGAFSKTFAANGGFLAMHSPAARIAISGYGGPWTFSNALSPVQTAVVSETLRIVRSGEGDELRARLAERIGQLRKGLAGHGIACLGQPSAIVPVPLGSEVLARLASALVNERGVLTNLAEFPAVAAGTARFRMQVMAEHSEQDVERAADVVADAVAEATSVLAHAGMLEES